MSENQNALTEQERQAIHASFETISAALDEIGRLLERVWQEHQEAKGRLNQGTQSEAE
jgi:hypothetical protein